MSEVLTLPMAAKRFLGIINAYLQRKPKETKELKNSLVKLVELSNNSSIRLRNYVSLMKWSIEAGANCTDLTMVLTALSKAEGKTRLENFKNTILANLKKQGIEAIHKYRDDYETVSKNFQNAVGYAKEAEQDFNDDKKDSCNEKMQHANNELDELIILGNRKLNELVDELQEAYTYLGQIGK